MKTKWGLLKMESGQPQDKGGSTLPSREKQLELDLRVIVSKGRNLNAEHCGKLRLLPSLKRVILAAAKPSREESAARLSRLPGASIGPMEIRDAVEGGIDRLMRAEGGELRQYGEVLRLLFGFAPGTRSRDTSARRLNAMKYWSQHANFDGYEESEQNFDRRIVERVLYPPLVDALLSWEDELHAHDAPHSLVPQAAVENMTQRWSHEFWWLFRIEERVCTAAANIELYLSWRFNSSPETSRLGDISRLIAKASLPTARASDMRGDESEEIVLGVIGCALRAVTDLRGLVRKYRDATESRLESSRALISAATNFERNLSDGDREWLEEYIRISPVDPFCQIFANITGGEGPGRVVVMRFRALAESCDCFQMARINRYCVMHLLISDWSEARAQLEKDWLHLARTTTFS